MITKDQHREIEARLERNRRPSGDCITDRARQQKDCDHKFVDSNHCLKCGWVPPSLGRVKKESGSIRILLDFWASEGVPEAEREFLFHPTVNWRFDFCWGAFGVGPKIYLEVQGGTWRKGGGAHRGKGAIRDMKKFSEATILGWRPLFCQPSELLTVETAKMIKRALKI